MGTQSPIVHHHASLWSRVLEPLCSRAADVLEVGSFEGASARAFLTLLPLSRITCVDPFTGNVFEDPDYNRDIATLEARFDANMAAFAGRVEKIKSRSTPALDALAEAGQRFDVIYIDGSHARDDVLLDSVLAWRVLRQGGLIIWDDYIGGIHSRPEETTAKPAIDLFLDMHRSDLTVIEIGGQVIARKAPSGTPPGQPGWTFARTPRNLLRFLTKQPLL
jgi:predicted O-methyltransferase YrrM